MNPHLELLPDYNSERHAATRQRLIDRGIDEHLIVPALEDIWRDNNAEKRELWDERLRLEAQATLEAERLAAEETDLRRRALADELELAKQEERKKYKNKYIPIPNVAVPTGPIIIPSAYALNKLRKGEYCELYYFTNRGLAEDENSLPSLDDEAMTLTKSENGTHSFIALSSAKAKALLIKDEDLSWEEFNQANFRMVNAMRQCEWAEERVRCNRHNAWLSLVFSLFWHNVQAQEHHAA
ncbi:hypothetical protein BU15DRAFT_68995 [Melanogaster broomeanus]|nr:hypothetical protein BU15DRAFT_68995 [Melanogaster broomeanus]